MEHKPSETTHVHVLEDGTVIEHTHYHDAEYTHGHTHDHDAEHTHGHTHDHDAEHMHGHTHDGAGGHTHTHTHQSTKAVLNRLAKIIGHLEHVRKMVESGQDCSEVLIQLSAVKSAINSTGKVILKDHISHCIVDAVENNDMETLEELNKEIDQFIK